MVVSSGRSPSKQLFLPRRRIPAPGAVISTAIHAALIGLVGAATRQPAEAPPLTPVQVSQASAVHYLVLPPPPRGSVVEPTRSPAAPRAAPVGATLEPKLRTPVVSVAREPGPPPPVPLVQAGPAVPTPAPAGEDTAPRPAAVAIFGAPVATAGNVDIGGPSRGLGEGDGAGHGGSKVAELVAGAGTACPTLRRPPSGAPPSGELAVAVAFVVDTTGAVDPRTVRVVQSPERPQTDTRFVPHIYAVSTTAEVDDGLRDLPPTAYDSTLTRDVVTHVRTLLFHPATRDGRVTRSAVLVSCQSPT